MSKGFYFKDADAAVLSREAKEEIQKKGGVVVLSLEEYERLREQAIPTYHLYGKEADELDALVDEGMEEYRAGKTIEASSISEALEKHGRGKKS